MVQFFFKVMLIVWIVIDPIEVLPLRVGSCSSDHLGFVSTITNLKAIL